MKKNLVVVLVISMVLLTTACSSSPPNNPRNLIDQPITLPKEETSDFLYDNLFARDLLSGRWHGELFLDFYEGVKDLTLVKNFIYIKLDAEFVQISNNLSELEMIGQMDFYYETPVVTRYQKDVKSVEFNPNRNHYVGPYRAKVNGVNGPEMYNQSAHVNFLDIAPITGGVHVKITYNTEPPFIQAYYHPPGEGAFFASDLYTLRQMGFITLHPDGENRAVFGPHAHLRPSLTGIEDNIYGYLEKISTEKRDEPLKHNENIDTLRHEAVKAYIEHHLGRWEIDIEPNTSIHYNMSDEDTISLYKGVIYNKIRNLSDDHVMKVITPTAVVAVRGTDFYINVIDDTTSIVKVYSGKVEVLVDSQMYTLTENQGLFIFGKENKIDEFIFDGSVRPTWW